MSDTEAKLVHSRSTISQIQSEPQTHSSSNDNDSLFDSKVWKEPLTKFAQASGITLSLFDEKLNRRCFVASPAPMSQRLVEAGFWNEDGLGLAIDSKAAAECLNSKKSISHVQLETFIHLAIPIVLENKIRAIFVIGWIPERFADPVRSDYLAKQIQAASMEIWQLMRMQQPMPKEKLTTHSQMLETFSLALLRQLIDQNEDRIRAERSKLISQAALAIAEASTESKICQIALTTLSHLTNAIEVSISIIRRHGDSEEIFNYVQSKNSSSSAGNPQNSNVVNQMTFPIPTAGSRPLGRIELKFSEPNLSDECLTDLQITVGQLGIALQKVAFNEALEKEKNALKGANSQLLHLHKMKDEFLATVSHELRTPLNAILGWAEILNDEGPTIRDFPSIVQTIRRNAKNQLHLIEDLLDVSRIISGKMSLQRELLEARSLLEQSIETVRPMIEARHQKLHLQISEIPLVFKGDATRIVQIFWNLLSNASKFTPEKGDITVVLESAGHYFRLTISDSGKGIPSDFLPHLFDRFSQADGSFTRRHGGLGLGLSIVRHLVELHGGTVSAASKGDNQGSTFSVYLPQNTTDLELDNAFQLSNLSAQQANTNPLILQGFKILLVDDEPESLRMTRFMLEKYGAQIETADSARHGFEKFVDWRPDLLVSDISMPGEGGNELIQRIRFLNPDEGGEIPGIALTALSSSEQKEASLRSGFQRHLAKPIQPRTLVQEIFELLRPSSEYSH